MKYNRITYLFVFFITILFLGSECHAFGLKDLGKKLPFGKKEEKKEKKQTVDINSTSIQLEESIFGATKMLVRSLMEMAEAVGKKETALKIQAVLDDLEKNKDKDDRKALEETLKEKFPEINNAIDDLKDIDIEKEATSKEAPKHVKKGLLYAGTGIILDKKAAEYAKVLTNVLPGRIRSNPLKAGNLKGILSLAKMVATEAPNQLKSAQGVLTNLTKYATAHNISLPTAAEKKDVLQKGCPSCQYSEEDFA